MNKYWFVYFAVLGTLQTFTISGCSFLVGCAVFTGNVELPVIKRHNVMTGGQSSVLVNDRIYERYKVNVLNFVYYRNQSTKHTGTAIK